MNACCSPHLRLLVLLTLLPSLASADHGLVFEGATGSGAGKHIVLISGDEEYRSEECLPMLARVLSQRHGFKCTVLFAINPASGTIAPDVVTNIPGLAALEAADLMVILTRFRELPDEQMAHIDRYLNSGRPIIGLRTATHAFAFKDQSASHFRRYDWRSREWPGGFGQQVLGETWVAHHGQHGKQSTRAVINPDLREHPVLRGVEEVWGPTDVYAVKHLPADARVLMRGQVLTGMAPDDPPVEGPQNDPMMPLIWLRDYTGSSGATSKVLCSTIGSGPDFESEGLRRLFVNACYCLVGLPVPDQADVRYVGSYKPTFFGFGKFKPGVKPDDLLTER
jgi:hypothetical protein